MPKSQVRKIASVGGKAHAKKLHEEMDEDEEDTQEHHGKQGFASMPKSQVRKIASMGGKAHAKKLHEEMDNEDEVDDSK